MSSFAADQEEYEQDPTDKVIEENNLGKADLDNMAQLEKEMENLGEESGEASPVSSSSGPKASSGARLPPGAMPTTQSGALDRLANEFWFPECRNCPCCKGYKHGCKCRVGPVEECQEPTCKTAPSNEVETAPVEPIKPRHKPTIVFKTAANPTPAAAPAAKVATPAPAPAAGAPAAIVTSPDAGDTRLPCTFFASPQGCRFGPGCRFKHEGAGTVSAAASPSSAYGGSPQASPQGAGGGAQQPCMFFAQGSCRHGAQCRFSHNS